MRYPGHSASGPADFAYGMISSKPVVMFGQPVRLHLTGNSSQREARICV